MLIVVYMAYRSETTPTSSISAKVIAIQATVGIFPGFFYAHRCLYGISQ
ncbi:hypothetical protein MPQ_1100 [Methylovorus sp. MP688]|nr:hypothetical protein MPQ_1100 [Methylovorus sp. MP688]